jgi:hypothetical protein
LNDCNVGYDPNIAVWRKARSAHLNRQAVVMARHGVPIDRSVLADWMGRTGALIAPVVDHMAKRLMADSPDSVITQILMIGCFTYPFGCLDMKLWFLSSWSVQPNV